MRLCKVGPEGVLCTSLVFPYFFLLSISRIDLLAGVAAAVFKHEVTVTLRLKAMLQDSISEDRSSSS